MLYRLYLYGTDAVDVDAPVVRMINNALQTNSMSDWKRDSVGKYLTDMDAESIKSEIEKKIPGKCHPIIVYPAYERCFQPFLFVATSYEVVQEVLPALYYVAAEYGLVFYNAEKDEVFYKPLKQYIRTNRKRRERQILAAIRQAMTPIWKERKIFEYQDREVVYSAYVVTLRKKKDKSYEDRAMDFYQCLKTSLAGNEELICENRAFIVKGSEYTIALCLEGYAKHAEMICFMEEGRPRKELIHRMGCLNAIRWMEQCTGEEKKDIIARMQFREMEERYKNPADRFVRSINITKQQRKEIFDFRYSGHGPIGSEVRFHYVPDDGYTDPKTVSVLKIEEESASFILPFFNDLYPYFYDRYYLTANHIPSQMWWDFIKKIKQAKESLKSNERVPEIESHIDRLDLYVLAQSESDDNTIREDPFLFLYNHRYDVAHFYDIFCQWAELQLDTYDVNAENGMFNIQGP